MNQDNKFERGNLLGVGVDILTMDGALASIDEWIQEGSPHFVCTVPAHTVMDALKDSKLRSIINSSDLATPDGMGVVWFFQIQGQKHIRRVYGPELCIAICSFGNEREYKHYFYGSTHEVLGALTDRLQRRFSGLTIVGSYSPPYRELTPAEDDEVIQIINSSGADIVWVGLGSPKQEFWMAEHLGKIKAPVMIGVGAAFDFLSGHKPQSPKWVQRSGLEWFFRFVSEPQRLWPRYRQYPKFAALAILQILGLKKYDLKVK